MAVETEERRTFSFELFPPRDAAAEEALKPELLRLEAAGPEFISVTYGANGSSRGVSLDVLRHLLENTSVTPMAHLTCVGSSYAEASQMIREFLDAGVTSFLALRGDPPAGVAEEDIHLGDLGSAGELVQLIHRVQKERVPFTLHDVPGFPGAKRVGESHRVTIAVAAFPNGHPRSRSRAQDIDTLLAKQAAGANLAISQLFFEADEYLSFVEAARAAGVTMRLLPGIMPVLNMARMKRVLELTLEAPPKKLIARLEAAETPEAAAAAGIDFTTTLARNLLDGGASGIHLYTFNRSEAPLAVLGGAGLLDTTRIPA
jgi:methylenetetrahydrofolate reductase (NADPH)